MANQYDKKYAQKDYYWGKQASPFCGKVLELLPPDEPRTLIDIGCGEGRNAVFFASVGYQVTAFDLSPQGVSKTLELADQAGVEIEAFQGNLLEYSFSEKFDVVFGHGCLHYIAPELRAQILGGYKEFTTDGGLNALSVFVKKSFIGKAPDSEATAHKWISGELLTHYHDWRIDYSTEYIFDCMSSGTPHQHAMALMVARKVGGVVSA